MKSVVLVPYCPLPVNTGSRVEMMKHLKVLKELGACRIVSARQRPVGAGWTPERLAEIKNLGFDVILREYDLSSLSFRQCLGMAYAIFFKAFGLERAFGHSNPYHRHAFPPDWWLRQTTGMDLAVINYSYWAWLPCACPKAIILHDLLSGYMTGGHEEETRDLSAADLVTVISKNEEDILRARGLSRLFWSPPLVDAGKFPLTDNVGMVGSGNRFNREGLDWLCQANMDRSLPVRIYGGLSAFAPAVGFQPVGAYTDSSQPYSDCGIIVMTTVQGMGVQIKVIEALANGRAIVARRGAMRGLPHDENAWIEVDSPQDMMTAIHRLRHDDAERKRLASAAVSYYNANLDSRKLRESLKTAYLSVSGSRSK